MIVHVPPAHVFSHVDPDLQVYVQSPPEQLFSPVAPDSTVNWQRPLGQSVAHVPLPQSQVASEAEPHDVTAPLLDATEPLVVPPLVVVLPLDEDDEVVGTLTGVPLDDAGAGSLVVVSTVQPVNAATATTRTTPVKRPIIVQAPEKRRASALSCFP